MATYSSLGVKIPLDVDVIRVAIESFRTIYFYFWTAFALLVSCLSAHLLLIRRHKIDFFDYSALTVRAVALAGAVAFVAVGVRGVDDLFALIESPYILHLIIILDRGAAWVANRLNRRSGEPLSEGHDGHGDDDEGIGQDLSGDVSRRSMESVIPLVPMKPVSRPQTPQMAWQGGGTHRRCRLSTRRCLRRSTRRGIRRDTSRCMMPHGVWFA